MKLNQYVDVLIPRGGAGLIRAVVENSTIPVIETGTGNCHIYVDKDADVDMAVKIIFNAKTQRIGVCNACESLVIHEDVREELLPKLSEALKSKQVEMRGDEGIRKYLKDCVPVCEEDYGREYLDYIVSMKTVSDIDEAITGRRREGVIGTFNTLIKTCVSTSVQSLVLVILGRFGLATGSEVTEYEKATGLLYDQPDSALLGVRLCVAIIPIVLALISPIPSTSSNF